MKENNTANVSHQKWVIAVCSTFFKRCLLHRVTLLCVRSHTVSSTVHAVANPVCVFHLMLFEVDAYKKGAVLIIRYTHHSKNPIMCQSQRCARSGFGVIFITCLNLQPTKRYCNKFKI